MRQKLYLILVFLIVYSCASTTDLQQQNTGEANRGKLIYSHDLSEAITRFIPSTVEVICTMNYDVEHYFYNTSAGEYIVDKTSPTGYQLQAKKPVLREKKNFRAFGGGVIIGDSKDEFLILTSRHIVVQEDTIVNFIKKNGEDTSVPRMRAFLDRIHFSARGQRHSLVKNARVVAGDSRADLALVAVSKRGRIGKIFYGHVIKELKNVWGSLAVIAGYPSEILQVAMGLTSAAPYPGNFSLDINGTFGYSGGPVFLFDDRQELAFAGIGRSIPGKRVYHVVPDSSLQFATKLLPTDIGNLQIEEVPVLGAARMYAVDIRFIKRFLSEAMQDLGKRGFRLASGFQKMLKE